MHRSTRAIRGLGLMAAVALFAAACGGQSATPSPSPTPTPTPTASPTPTPTPVDVGAITHKTVQASDYSASFTLAGTGTFGGQTLTSTGTWDLAGGDSHTTTHEVMGTQSWTTDSVEVGGKSWDSSDGGPYIPSATSCSTIADALRLAKGLVDQGVVAKDGQQVHRLSIDGGVDPSCSAGANAAIQSMKLTIELYATDAGKVVSVSEAESWTQLMSGQPTAAAMTVDATATGSPAGAIAAPAAPWSLYEDTESHFRVAIPAGWDEESFQGRPSLRDPDHKYIVEFLASKLPTGYTFEEYAKVDRASLNKLTSMKLNTSQATDLGGEAGGLFEFHYVAGTEALHGLDVYTVHAGSSFDVFWLSAPGSEKADYTMFSTIVNSLVFTE